MLSTKIRDGKSGKSAEHEEFGTQRGRELQQVPSLAATIRVEDEVKQAEYPTLVHEHGDPRAGKDLKEASGRETYRCDLERDGNERDGALNGRANNSDSTI